MKQTTPFIQGKLRLSITDACNMHCFYCHNEGQSHLGCRSYLPLEFVENLADYLRRSGMRIDKLNITGGEPLLHPKLEEIIRCLSPYCRSIRLNTNSKLLTEEKADRLLALGVRSFKIGADSFWGEASEAWKKADLQQLSRLLKYLQGRASVVINMVVTRFNHSRIDDMVNFCGENGVKRLKINELVDYDFRRDGNYDSSFQEAFHEAWNRYRAQCTAYLQDVNIGRDDMVLPNGLTLRFCNSFCKSRACGGMYTILNAKGELVTCPVSGESLPLQLSPDRPAEAITADIREAARQMCHVSGRKYLRDINGRPIPILKQQPGWEWEQETDEYWKIPEPAVYWLEKRWEKSKEMPLLDLGTGMGRNALEFARAGFQVEATDLSEFGLSWLTSQAEKENLAVHTTLADMTDLPYEDETVGNVFAWNVVSHNDSYGLKRTMDEIYRVLQPGGEAYLTFCSKASGAWRHNTGPVLDSSTAVKLKPGPEYGLPHCYVEEKQLKLLLDRFEILDIQHISHCFCDGKAHDSFHYHVLIRKCFRFIFQAAGGMESVSCSGRPKAGW